ncbi:AMP-dependent synthetase and ligase [Nitzschia inconspicua]|uniref:AMP-dependent synthetase and ligase n=1 Tax=Nitzschia inconspicua TaxID=303405 RepID=A0A9K3Q4A7_9STRA|nr:AMP-dependent synthetase and ligase [Nitzschia inconspicua]
MKRRTLLSEIESVAKIFPEAPCCCSVLSEEDGDNSQQRQLYPKILTYESFWKCLQLHGVWLQNLLENVNIVGSRRKVPLNDTNVPDTDVSASNTKSDDDDIVVAYLSSNSIDMLASVLAASTSSISNHNATIALLNTRWSYQEMITALQPKRSSNSQSVTIVLHDSYFQTVAQKIASSLEAMSDAEHQHTFIAAAMTIPSFSHSFSQCYKSDLQDCCCCCEYYGSLPPLSLRKASIIDTSSRDDAFVLFTSGTSGGGGGPKGVRISHQALLIQALAKLDVRTCGYSTQTKMLASTVPLFHVGGLNSILACLLAGGTLLFPETNAVTSQPTFRVEDITVTSFALPTTLSTNTLVVVPAMLSALYAWIDQQQQEQQQKQKQALITNGDDNSANINGNYFLFPHVRMILIGGQSASVSLLLRTRATFPNARIVQTYACTEAASSLTFWDVSTTTQTRNTDNERKTKMDDDNDDDTPSGDCVGYPPSHVQLALVSHNGSADADGTAIADNKSPSQYAVSTPYTLGVIATRGPHVMNGYWIQRGSARRNDKDTSLTREDWYLGGDLGYWDENGRLYFGGRVADTIRTGGETVLALEVERILEQHPSIQECAVFPLPHSKYGEAVACAVVIKDHALHKMDLDEVKRWCRLHGMTGYKHPKSVFVVDTLPRNSSGKILKQKLIAQLRAAPEGVLRIQRAGYLRVQISFIFTCSSYITQFMDLGDVALRSLDAHNFGMNAVHDINCEDKNKAEESTMATLTPTTLFREQYFSEEDGIMKGIRPPSGRDEGKRTARRKIRKSPQHDVSLHF